MKTIKYELLLKSKEIKKINLGLILNKEDKFNYTDDELQFKFKDDEYSFTIKETHFKESEEGCVIRLEMDNPDIYKIEAIEDLIAKIKIELSKEKISSTTLYDGISPFFYKELAGYLHDYEWKLRKMLYLLMNGKSDIDELVSKEDLNDIKKREKGKFNKLKFDLFQQLTLNQLETFIFSKNYIDTEIEEQLTTIKYQEMSHENLLEILLSEEKKVSKPYSLWDKHLVTYLSEDAETVQDDMERIRISRNTISHNKEMAYKNYIELKDKLLNYIGKFKELIKNIFEGRIKENDVKIIVEDFDFFSRNTMQAMEIVSKRLDSFPSENIIQTMSLAGQNFDTEILSGLAKTASIAGQNFDTEILSGLAKTASIAGQNFDTEILSGLAKTASIAGQSLNSEILSGLSKTASIAGQNFDTEILSGLAKTASIAGQNFDTEILSGLSKTASIAGQSLNSEILSGLSKTASIAGQGLNTEILSELLFPNSHIMNLANQNLKYSSQYNTAQEISAIHERLRPNLGELIAQPYSSNIYQNPKYNLERDSTGFSEEDKNELK